MVGHNISRATASFGILLCLLVSAVVHCSGEAICSRKCIAEQCDTVGIKYGKYCGVGHSGCPGEEPCDDLDACCMAHDACVGKFGMTHVKCHTKLRNCLIKVQKSGKVGFSNECPYSTAAPTMIRGMDLAILLSQLGNSVVLSSLSPPTPLVIITPAVKVTIVVAILIAVIHFSCYSSSSSVILSFYQNTIKRTRISSLLFDNFNYH
ncbi:hypothetical protein RJT34_29571 [Clitoria ternatea]|uniref:phospholipase A2 n=1 Tax=Clitoria ternatea TaxID=43366 RepID=A0AAN9I9Q6_CLITE